MDARRRTLIGAGIGAGAGLLLVLLVGASQGGSFDPVAVVIVPIGLAALGADLVASVEGGRPFHLRQWVPLPAEEIRRHATRWYAVSGWTAHGGDPDALSFTRRIGPNVAVGLLLLFFDVVPGLLYLLLAGGELTTTLLTTPAPGGTEIEIIVNRRSDGGQAAAARFFNSLHDLI